MNDEQQEAELRSAIRSQAESVHPTDRLGAIRARTQGGSVQWWRRPSALAVGAALVAASVIAVAVTLADSDPTGSDAPVAASPQREVTIYEVERVGENLWLDPEQVMAEDTGEPALDAVRALTSSDWGPCAPGGVQAVDFGRRLVTVEFAPANDYCPLSGDLYAVQAQQLAWTLRAATGSDQPVRAPGVGATVADPGALSPVLIDSPDDGDTVTSPVRVTGTSDTFEANVQWQVLQDDEGVLEGFTSGGTMGERGPFRFTVDLEPGEYTVWVYETSAEDGSLFAEDKDTFTVE